jgi:hypothetical protein
MGHVLWALSKLGEIEIELDWFDARRPDAYSECLFAASSCAVEVTAISDARLTQDEDMRRIAARLCEFANSVRKGHGKHLHFTSARRAGTSPRAMFAAEGLTVTSRRTGQPEKR